MSRLIGIDIGGTKCAVSLGETEGETLSILAKKIFATPNRDPNAAIQKIISSIWELARENRFDAEEISAIGIACGGPLDSERGLVLSPPNLPGWDNVGIVSEIVKVFKSPCRLQEIRPTARARRMAIRRREGTSRHSFSDFRHGAWRGAHFKRRALLRREWKRRRSRPHQACGIRPCRVRQARVV